MITADFAPAALLVEQQQTPETVPGYDPAAFNEIVDNLQRLDSDTELMESLSTAVKDKMASSGETHVARDL